MIVDLSKHYRHSGWMSISSARILMKRIEIVANNSNAAYQEQGDGSTDMQEHAQKYWCNSHYTPDVDPHLAGAVPA